MQPPPVNEARSRVVVADANVLINLIHVGRLGLCSSLPTHEFLVPEHVRAEIRRPRQREMVDEAISEGILRTVSLSDPSDLSLFAELTVFLGRGEAACLVLAQRHGWMIASDEKRRFRREAISRLGEKSLLTTVGLYLLSIEAGLLSVEEADTDKGILEHHRFKMAFESFQGIVNSEH